MAISGNNPIVVAPPPPFAAEEQVDHGMLARNIGRLMPTPLDGFVLGTINGEENALSEDEKAAIVGPVADVAGSEPLVIARIDNPSPADTIRQATRFTELGADLIRVRLPRGLEPGMVIEYFSNILPRSPSPVAVIHQTPTRDPAAPSEIIGAICQMDNVYGYVTDHDIRFESWSGPTSRRTETSGPATVHCSSSSANRPLPPVAGPPAHFPPTTYLDPANPALTHEPVINAPAGS